MKKKEKKEIIQRFLYLMNAEYHSYQEILSQMNNAFQSRKALILMRELSENLKAENWKALFF